MSRDAFALSFAFGVVAEMISHKIWLGLIAGIVAFVALKLYASFKSKKGMAQSRQS